MESIELLIERLGRGPDEAAVAERALAALIPCDRTVLAPLRAALKGAEGELRERLAFLLATVAPDTLARFPGLPGVLVFEEDDEDSGRPRPRLERVAGAVGGAPPPGSARAPGSAAWIAASPVAERAAPLLAAAGGADIAVAQLSALLADAEPGVRELAAEVLAKLERLDEGTQRALAAAIDDPHPWVRAAAIAALDRPLPGAWQWRAALKERLSDPHPAVRCAAVKALAAMLVSDPGSIHAIARLHADRVPDVRATVAEALASCDAGGVGALVTLASDWMNEVRSNALRATARRGPAALALVPTLTNQLGEKRPALELEEAFTALVAVGPEAVPGVIAAVRSRRGELWWLIEALLELGQHSRAVIAPLVELLSEHDSCTHAAGALERLDPTCHELFNRRVLGDFAGATLPLSEVAERPELVRTLVPQLTGLLRDRTHRYAAAVALGCLGAVARGACNALAAITQSFNAAVARLPPAPGSTAFPNTRTYLEALNAWLAGAREGERGRDEAASNLATWARGRFEPLTYFGWQPPTPAPRSAIQMARTAFGNLFRKPAVEIVVQAPGFPDRRFEVIEGENTIGVRNEQTGARPHVDLAEVDRSHLIAEVHLRLHNDNGRLAVMFELGACSALINGEPLSMISYREMGPGDVVELPSGIRLMRAP